MLCLRCREINQLTSAASNDGDDDRLTRCFASAIHSAVLVHCDLQRQRQLEPCGVTASSSLLAGKPTVFWTFTSSTTSKDQSFDKGLFLQNMQSMSVAYGSKGWPSSSSSSSGGAKPCTNSYPYNDGYSCEQQAGWGKCGQSFMKSPVCDRSCGRC